MGMLFVGVVLGFALANYASERDAWAAEETPAMSASADAGVGGQGVTVYPPDVSFPAPVSVGAAPPADLSIGTVGSGGATQSGPGPSTSSAAADAVTPSSITPAVSAGWWWLVAAVLCALAGPWWWAARRRRPGTPAAAPKRDVAGGDAAAVLRRYLPAAAAQDPLEAWAAAGTGGASSTSVSAPRDDVSVQPPRPPDEPAAHAPAEQSAPADGEDAPHPSAPATDQAVQDAHATPPAPPSPRSTPATPVQVWGAATEDSSYTVLWRRPA